MSFSCRVHQDLESGEFSFRVVGPEGTTVAWSGRWFVTELAARAAGEADARARTLVAERARQAAASPNVASLADRRLLREHGVDAEVLACVTRWILSENTSLAGGLTLEFETPLSATDAERARAALSELNQRYLDQVGRFAAVLAGCLSRHPEELESFPPRP